MAGPVARLDLGVVQFDDADQSALTSPLPKDRTPSPNGRQQLSLPRNHCMLCDFTCRGDWGYVCHWTIHIVKTEPDRYTCETCGVFIASRSLYGPMHDAKYCALRANRVEH